MANDAEILILRGYGKTPQRVDTPDGVYTLVEDQLLPDVGSYTWREHASQLTLGGVPLVTGMYAVLGGPGTGKSNLMQMFEQQVPGAKVVRHAEPDNGAAQPHPFLLTSALNLAREQGAVVLVDGLRYMSMVGGSSSLQKGGIPRDLAVVASVLQYWALKYAMVVIAAVNLMTDDVEAGESARQLFEASCQGVIITRGWLKATKTSGSVEGTVHARPEDRTGVRFTTPRFTLRSRNEA